MRLRAALATLTAVLLLTISCAASACSASCAAMALGSGCPHGSASHASVSGGHSGHQMSDMSHREMTGPNDMADLAIVMLSSSLCTQHVCELAPTLLRSDYGGAQLLEAIQPMFPSSHAFFAPEMEPQIEAVGHPPLRSRLVVALQTTLRI